MRKKSLTACLAAVAAALAATAAPAGAAVTWTTVASPPPAVAVWAALSARTDGDAWAVGIGSATTPLVAHWTGSAWSQVAGPTVTGANSTVPYAVSASSASDAWLVGRSTKLRQITALAAHWNGTSWSVAPTPGGGALLRSVADISASDAYAVGNTAAMHWDGAAWSPISVPAPGGIVTLDAVAADSPGDVWITGQYLDPVLGDQPFTAHFNGTAWAEVPVPLDGAELFGLTAISPADVWAVGSRNGNAVTENFDGNAWRVVPNPAQGLLLSVTATGAGNVTAVGHDTTANGPTTAIIISWNGSSWVGDTVPAAGATQELYSTSAAPGGTITWALGSATSSGGVTGSLLLRNG